MFVKRISHFLLLLALAMTALHGCGDDKAYYGAEDQKSNPLVQDANKLKDSINQGQTMGAATSRDRLTIERILVDVQSGALTLQKNPKHGGALTLLVNALRSLSQFGFLQEDQLEMQRFFKQLSAQIEHFARIQGKSIQNIGFNLFTYRFSNGLAPFGNFKTDGNGWTTREALDRWFTSVNIFRPRSRTQAWLMSPTFDLTNVRNPKFKIRHSYNLRNEDPEKGFSSTKIINNAFKALVSTDYTIGDPTKKGTWTEIPMYSRLTGMDFDTGSSNLMDLSAFEGQKVTIAFAVDYDPKVFGSHAIGWSIEEFNLQGVGTLGEITPRAGEVFEYEFRNRKFKPFQVRTLLKDGAKWFPDGRGGRVEWMLAKANKNTEADAWLFSPSIDLANAKDMVMEIEQTVYNQIWEIMDAYISTSYDGSDPRTFNDWEKIQLSNDTGMPLKKFNSFSTSVDLKKYAGEKIVVAFNFKADKGQTRSDIWDQIADDRKGLLWEIKSLKIIGLGGELRYKEVPLQFDSVPDTPPAVTEESVEGAQ